MKRIYGKTLNHIAYCNNKVLCAPCRDNGLYNGCNILLLIVTAAALGLVQQLLNNIGILIWQGLPYLRPGIFGRDHSAHTHKMAQHCLVPLIQILALLLYKLKLLLRIIDERTELALVLLAQRTTKNILYLILYYSRCISKNVVKSIILPVDIRDKVLRALWQVHYCLKIYYLCAGRLYIGEAAAKQFEIFEIIFHNSHYLYLEQFNKDR